jgi:site-specific DNA-cytosine methylase
LSDTTIHALRERLRFDPQLEAETRAALALLDQERTRSLATTKGFRANSSRLRIVEALSNGPLTPGELKAALPDIRDAVLIAAVHEMKRRGYLVVDPSRYKLVPCENPVGAHDRAARKPKIARPMIRAESLDPAELARAQGFPDDYILTGTKAQQIARIGNSVCPPVIQKIVEANFGPRRESIAA